MRRVCKAAPEYARIRVGTTRDLESRGFPGARASLPAQTSGGIRRRARAGSRRSQEALDPGKPYDLAGTPRKHRSGPARSRARIGPDATPNEAKHKEHEVMKRLFPALPRHPGRGGGRGVPVLGRRRHRGRGVPHGRAFDLGRIRPVLHRAGARLLRGGRNRGGVRSHGGRQDPDARARRGKGRCRRDHRGHGAQLLLREAALPLPVRGR